MDECQQWQKRDVWIVVKTFLFWNPSHFHAQVQLSLSQDLV